MVVPKRAQRKEHPFRALLERLDPGDPVGRNDQALFVRRSSEGLLTAHLRPCMILRALETFDAVFPCAAPPLELVNFASGTLSRWLLPSSRMTS
jgi:hypothetical protein